MKYSKISHSFLAWLTLFVLIFSFIPYSFLGQKARAAEEGLVGSWHMDEMSLPDANNLIDPSTWTVGTGSAPGFTRNGDDAENYRINATTPFGGQDVVWEARPTAVSGADGGWNGSQFNINNTQKYRFSVWVQRPVQGNGHFYLGTHGYGSTDGVLLRTTGANSTNPYFTVNSNWNEWGDNSSWYLAVGHVWPAGSGTGGKDGESGIYNTSGSLVYTSDLNDYVWRSETTTSNFRTYLYYSTDTSTRQRWVYPRVDVVDGSEPSIQDLINSAPTGAISDSSGNGNNGTVLNNAALTTGKYGSALSFDGTDDYVRADSVAGDIANKPLSVFMWIKTNVNNGETVAINTVTGGNRLLFRVRNNVISVYDGSWHDGSATVTDNIWHHIGYVYDTSAGTIQRYVDGEPDGSVVSWSVTVASDDRVSIGQEWDGDSPSDFFNGTIDEVKVYNRALSPTEVGYLYHRAPVHIYTNNAVNPIDITNSSPTLSAEYDDFDTSDTASFYEIQVIADGGSWASPYWGSTKSACSVTEGDRLGIIYSGSALDLNYQKYYQRWKFWDSIGAEGDWSDGTDYFVTAAPKDEYGANVRGYAWSDNIGWLSFNNDDPATSVDYGVNVDEESNKLSGHVWSENLGWISFDRDETGTPPSDDPCADESCLARLKLDNYQLDGWMRALNYGDGWDGWISLNKKTGDAFDYEVVFNPDSKEFEGWAYGSDVLGWISFNHLTDGSGVDYMVYSGLPLGIQPTDPHDTWELCADSLHPTLNWAVAGDINGYEVEIYSDADLNNLVYLYQADISSISHHAGYDASNIDDTIGTCHLGGNGFQNTGRCNLQYGETSYWWKVRVRNTDNVWGEWSTIDDFTVVSNHHWPIPSFSTNPESPQTGSVTHFLDETAVYGGATAASWQWLFSGGLGTDYEYANETSSVSQNPDITFLNNNSETVGLGTTDSDGYGPCSCSGLVDITSGSIQWQEVSPTP